MYLKQQQDYHTMQGMEISLKELENNHNYLQKNNQKLQEEINYLSSRKGIVKTLSKTSILLLAKIKKKLPIFQGIKGKFPNAPKSGKVMLRIRGENTVPHSIVTETCEGVADCVSACPVACIHPGPGKNVKGTDWYWIDFATCIDCGICLQVCPVEGAILPEERPDLQKTP